MASGSEVEYSQAEPFQYESLPPGCHRFFVLEPCDGDKNEPTNLVRGTFEYGSPDSIGHFQAIKHARGYRLFRTPILVDDKELFVSLALEIFLRNFRRADESVRIWTRYLCLEEANEAERTQFWTRPVVESIYAQAAGSIDMVEYLWHLLDQKEIKRVYNSNVDRDKEWEFVPQNFPLPKVSPVWLGTRFPPTIPRQRYHYVPLDPVCDEIRLILLPPARDPAEELEVYIYHEPIRSDVRYSALSYAWGDGTEMVYIVANGQNLAIRESLKRCLIKLRQPEMPVIFWIDAISINQADVAERNRQVPRMGDIFYEAGSVVCYLENPDETGETALELAHHLQSPMMRFSDDGVWDVDRDHYSGDEELPFAGRCAILYRLATQEYFRRVWIIQEVAFSSNPTILCGLSSNGSLQQFAHAAYNLRDMMIRDSELVEEMTGFLISLGMDPPDPKQLDYIRKLDYLRQQHRDQSRDLLRLRRGQDTPHFLEIAIFVRQSSCSVVHDKIFGIWNLAGDKDKLDYHIDYSKPAQEKFTEFSVSWCKANGRLDIIGTSEMAPEDPSSYYSGAPSWSTDWGSRARVSCLVRRDTLPDSSTRTIDYQGGARYMADGNIEQSPTNMELFTFDGTILKATAVILDTLRSSIPLEDRTFTMKDSDEVLLEKTYGDVGRAFLATCMGDSTAAWPPKSENMEYADETHFPEEHFVCRPFKWGDYPNWPKAGDRSRYIQWYGGDYSRLDAQAVGSMIMRGRRPIVTENGYLGIAPDYIQDYMDQGPCVLALLASCSVPVIMQESTTQQGSYKLLGTCFVQGWMDGEMVLGRVGDGTAREFWLSDKAQKIKII